MALYYGVKLSEFMDVPDEPIPGVDLKNSEKLSPAKRLVLRSVAQKLGPDQVSDADAEKFLKALEAMIESGILRSDKD